MPFAPMDSHRLKPIKGALHTCFEANQCLRWHHLDMGVWSKSPNTQHCSKTTTLAHCNALCTQAEQGQHVLTDRQLLSLPNIKELALCIPSRMWRRANMIDSVLYKLNQANPTRNICLSRSTPWLCMCCTCSDDPQNPQPQTVGASRVKLG